MHCPRCKAHHALYSYSTNRRGMTETHYGWVPERLSHELTDLCKRRDDGSESLAIYLETRYGRRWREHFRGKTRRAIWTELAEDGRKYPSLATFYFHVRSSGLEKVLNEYLAYREVETVRRILNLDDSRLGSTIKGIQDLEHAIKRKEREVRQQMVV